MCAWEKRYQTMDETSNFERKRNQIWKNFVENIKVSLEDIVAEAEKKINENDYEEAGILYDAAGKRIELKKIILPNAMEVDSLCNFVQIQMNFMIKSGEALLIHLDRMEDDLLKANLDASSEKTFNEYSIILQFIRKLLCDATNTRKSQYADTIKDSLRSAEVLLMQSYFKPKFNTKQENVLNYKLCTRAIDEFFDTYGENFGDHSHEICLIMQQLGHPKYRQFLEKQISFGELRYPDNTLIVDPYGFACFKTINEALKFVLKEAMFLLVRSLLKMEENPTRTQYSILVQPETYENDLKLVMPKNVDIDIVGNVGRYDYYGFNKNCEKPPAAVVRLSRSKIEGMDRKSLVTILEGRNSNLRLARLEIFDVTDLNDSSILIDQGSSVEIKECLLVSTGGGFVVSAKGFNTDLKIISCAIEESHKAFSINNSAKLYLMGSRLENIGEDGCMVNESICHITNSKFINAKNIKFSGKSRGIFNDCNFHGEWKKSVNTSLKGSIYKCFCLEDAARVSIQNCIVSDYEVAVFALNPENHVALGHTKIYQCKVCAEICENAGATLRNNEINSDIILGVFGNSQGKIVLEHNKSVQPMAMILVDEKSRAPLMIGPQYEVMSVKLDDQQIEQEVPPQPVKEEVQTENSLTSTLDPRVSQSKRDKKKRKKKKTIAHE